MDFLLCERVFSVHYKKCPENKQKPDGKKLHQAEKSFNFAYAIALTLRVMLLFLRAALFLCRIPLLTALSTATTAAV